MLSERTWPNYRGSEQDGVKILVNDFKLTKDVTFGNTKLFIQSPESLFHLEEARDKHLPKIAIFLQKIWRGVRARRLFKRMKAALSLQKYWRGYMARKMYPRLKAALRIGLYYRHCVRRGYVRRLCSTYQNVQRLPDLGKSLKWPKEVPRPLKSVDPLIHNIFIRWRAFKILSKYPRESWPEMHLKITALELLKGKRMQWGIQRKWRRDYLNDTSQNEFVDAYRDALNKAGFNPKNVLMSMPTKKFNKHSKINDRGLVITKDDLLKLKMEGKKIKKDIDVPLSDILSVSISPDAGNQLLIIHLKQTGPNNDLILKLNCKNEDVIGEVLGVLASQYLKKLGRNLEVKSSNHLTARSGKNNKTILVQSTGPNATFSKNKDGTIIFAD